MKQLCLIVSLAQTLELDFMILVLLNKTNHIMLMSL